MRFEKTSSASDLSQYHMHLMRHCIGLNYKKPRKYQGMFFYKPSRNYFCARKSTKDYSCWIYLKNKGLADTKSDLSKDNPIYFYLTKTGLLCLKSKFGIDVINTELIASPGEKI